MRGSTFPNNVQHNLREHVLYNVKRTWPHDLYIKRKGDVGRDGS